MEVKISPAIHSHRVVSRIRHKTRYVCELLITIKYKRLWYFTDITVMGSDIKSEACIFKIISTQGTLGFLACVNRIAIRCICRASSIDMI